MKLDEIILTVPKNENEPKIECIQNLVVRKNQLIDKIIFQLTNDPKSDQYELITAFFAIAENSPSDRTISAFQTMYYTLKDADELKQLLKYEDVK